MKNYIHYIRPAIIIILAVIFFIWGVQEAKSANAADGKTVEVEATVKRIENERINGENGDYIDNCKYHLEYTYNGDTYDTVFIFESSDYRKGDKLLINVKTDDPTSVSYGSNESGGMVFFIAAAALIGSAAYNIYLIRKKKNEVPPEIMEQTLYQDLNRQN